MTGYQSKRAAAQDKLDSMEREARELASQFGSRMCDENGDTHGEELYCFSLDEIIAIKATLAQPAQEPTEAWPCVIETADFEEDTVTLAMQCTDYKVSAGKHWLSTIPPQRTWVGLTDEEVDEVHGSPMSLEHSALLDFVRAIEDALRKKNT